MIVRYPVMFPRRRLTTVGGHHNIDKLRKNRGIVWYVIFVGQDQLQLVTTQL